MLRVRYADIFKVKKVTRFYGFGGVISKNSFLYLFFGIISAGFGNDRMNLFHEFLVFIKAFLFNKFVYCMLNSLLRLQDLLYKHFGAIFRVIALGYHTMILCVVDSLDALGYEFLLFPLKLLLLFLVLFDFLLEHFSDGLIRRGEEVVGQEYLLAIGQRRLMRYGGVEIEQKGQVKGFVWVQQLVLEAKALYLVKV